MPISPVEKFNQELGKMVLYWRTEFELDKFSVTGALLDTAVDVLFGGLEPDLNDDDDEDEDEDEDEDFE